MSKIPPPPAPKKEVITSHHEILAAEPAEEEGSEERNYGEARLWLAARDPHSVFVYWEFRPEEHPHAAGKDGHARFFLRIIRDGGAEAGRTEIESGAGNVFIPVQTPDSSYVAELGFFAEGTWCFIARSGAARTPPELPSSDAAPLFATIPAHLSLTKMRALLSGSALPGESVAMTAARIQNDARNHGEWTPEHERLLAEILGVSVSTPAAPSASSFTLTVRQKLSSTALAAKPGAPLPSPQIEGAPASPGTSWPSSR